MEIKAAMHKQNSTDYPQACKKCRRLFYVPRYINGETVVCPHCGAKH